MRKLNVTIECLAMYNSSIMVPSELTFEEAIEYAKNISLRFRLNS